MSRNSLLLWRGADCIALFNVLLQLSARLWAHKSLFTEDVGKGFLLCLGDLAGLGDLCLLISHCDKRMSSERVLHGTASYKLLISSVLNVSTFYKFLQRPVPSQKDKNLH